MYKTALELRVEDERRRNGWSSRQVFCALCAQLGLDPEAELAPLAHSLTDEGYPSDLSGWTLRPARRDKPLGYHDASRWLSNAFPFGNKGVEPGQPASGGRFWCVVLWSVIQAHGVRTYQIAEGTHSHLFRPLRVGRL
jgi:hypothetical protein